MIYYLMGLGLVFEIIVFFYKNKHILACTITVKHFYNNMCACVKMNKSLMLIKFCKIKVLSNKIITVSFLLQLLLNNFIRFVA